MSYNWRSYYQKVYELEKKKNTILAGQVADAETKKAELQDKYGRICGNPFYRMLRPFNIVGRGCKKLARKTEEFIRDRARGELFPQRKGGRPIGDASGKNTPEELRAAYQERLLHQTDAYGEWLKEEEPLLWKKWALEENGKKREKDEKRCTVVSYDTLKGITSVTELKPDDSAMISGKPDILLFAEEPSDLDERAVSYIENWFVKYPETKLFYGQEDFEEESTGKRKFPWCKPCWSPDTLLGFFYLGSYFAVDRAWAEKVILKGYEDAKENLYDFVLRLLFPYFSGHSVTELPKESSERENYQGWFGREIVCSELLLYHRKGSISEHPADREYFLHTGEMTAGEHPEFWGYEEKYIKLKQDFIKELGFSSFSYQTAFPEVWTVVPSASESGETLFGTIKEKPLLSVIIPSKDHPELLKKCIGSFLERTFLPGTDCFSEKLQAGKRTYPVEFIVVDNGSSEVNRKETEDYLISTGTDYRYLYESMEFNFSAMCNRGVKAAKGEYILLLNDDMEIIEENWLRILLGQALLPGTGAVGAKLWYPEGERIQHAGITNMHIGPSHKLVTFPDDRVYYYGHNTVPYDMIAVTGACLLVKKALFMEVGGMDESMAVSYNDVDFCFKLAEAGYRNVIRNDAVLLHHESASRGPDVVSEEKWQRLLREKAKLYKKHPIFYKWDSYYGNQLIDNAPDYRIGYQYPYEKRLLTETPEKHNGKAGLCEIVSDRVMLTVERGSKQRKIHLEEPDIVEIEGWCYVLNEDNSLFERWLVLEAEAGDFYYRVPVKERRRPDVEAILPEQKNIALSGFTCRILKDDLISGNYKVGMLYQNLLDGSVYYQCGDISV